MSASHLHGVIFASHNIIENINQFVLHFSIDATFSSGYGRFANDAPTRTCNAVAKVIHVDDTPHLFLFAFRTNSETKFRTTSVSVICRGA